jgi:hypothetical protein
MGYATIRQLSTAVVDDESPMRSHVLQCECGVFPARTCAHLGASRMARPEGEFVYGVSRTGFKVADNKVAEILGFLGR